MFLNKPKYACVYFCTQLASRWYISSNLVLSVTLFVAFEIWYCCYSWVALPSSLFQNTVAAFFVLVVITAIASTTTQLLLYSTLVLLHNCKARRDAVRLFYFNWTKLVGNDAIFEAGNRSTNRNIYESYKCFSCLLLILDFTG